jgi:hypothetical protein
MEQLFFLSLLVHSDAVSLKLSSFIPCPAPSFPTTAHSVSFHTVAGSFARTRGPSVSTVHPPPPRFLGQPFWMCTAGPICLLSSDMNIVVFTSCTSSYLVGFSLWTFNSRDNNQPYRTLAKAACLCRYWHHNTEHYTAHLPVLSVTGLQ